MRILTFLATVLLLSSSLLAQYKEVGMAVGVANYAGELTADGFRPSEYHPSIGIFGRYNHSPRLAAKGSVTVGQISGSDVNSGNPSTLVRNLDFRSPIYEIAAMGEFNITPYAIRNNQGAALYLTAGVAGFYFNPQAQFNGEWFDLQPLGTEGQGSAANPDMKRYSRVQAAIPFGGGLKLNVTDRFNLGIEVIFRRTFTDYLDDISGLYPDIEALYQENPLAATLSYRSPQYTQQSMGNPVGKNRGNSDVKDYYMFMQVTMSFNLTHKQGLDFDDKYDIFKDPPPALSTLMSWELIPQA